MIMENRNTSCREIRFVIAVLVLLLITSVPAKVFATADYTPSAWAAAKTAIAETAGIMPANFGGRPFTADITRRDFCELLIEGCRLFAYPLPEAPSVHPFADTRDEIPEMAYALGLTSGTAAGVFSPDLPLTREMAVVMLGRLRLLLQPEIQLLDKRQAEDILQRYAEDGGKISGWAKTAMADAYFRGIIGGTAIGVLSPLNNVTREQAVLLTLNTLAYCDASRLNGAGEAECYLPAPSGIFIPQSYRQGEVSLVWGEVPAAAGYEVVVYSGNVPVYSTGTKETSLNLGTSSGREDIFGDGSKTVRGAIGVIPLDEAGRPSVFQLWREFTVVPAASRRETVPSRSLPRYKSAAEALPNMRKIEVQVWQLAAGEKKPAAITLSVHKDVAGDVMEIFAEIFAGEEKFPIKSCYGYSFRGASQHSNGMAIDINPDENYFIGRDGTVKAGKLWQPGVNPYSIRPDGDVVRAFRKYGWHWSPDMHWSSGADYMHFSLSGT